MRRLALLVTFLASTLATALAPACNDGELDCRQLCNEAQDKDCTSITGDCGDFCEALTNVQDDSGCADEREAYSDCLNDKGVCAGECNGAETALTTCLGTYCAGHASEPDCMTLINSF
jgi:hypothetical protein